jgi:hypothetical protein
MQVFFCIKYLNKWAPHFSHELKFVSDSSEVEASVMYAHRKGIDIDDDKFLDQFATFICKKKLYLPIRITETSFWLHFNIHAITINRTATYTETRRTVVTTS